MPKMKSRRAARKRFKVTGSGKITRRRANKSHLLTKKHPKRKRRLGQPITMSHADEGRIRPLLGKK